MSKKSYLLALFSLLGVLYIYQQSWGTVGYPTAASNTKRILSSESTTFAFEDVSYMDPISMLYKANFSFNLTPTTTLGDLIEVFQTAFARTNSDGEKVIVPVVLFNKVIDHNLKI